MAAGARGCRCWLLLLLLLLVFLLPGRARSPKPSPRCSHARGWVMSTAPSLSALRSSKHSGGSGGSGGGGADPAWTSALSGNSSSSGPGPGSAPAGSTKPFVHAVPPSDPLRQANRLPIKVLKMLTARTGHILHPEYLQPLPSTPVSPIEVRNPSFPVAMGQLPGVAAPMGVLSLRPLWVEAWGPW